MNLQETVRAVMTVSMVRNVYIDLHGHVRPKNFPKAGMWRYDGQFFYLPKEQQL